MNDSLPKGPSAFQQGKLYDQNYFSGQTSGYDTRGYRECHPDWAPWLDFIGQLAPTGILIDLGCAYGFLAEEARKRGYKAYGLDISSFALNQEPLTGAPKIGADVRQLPLKRESADIICLFDVLEHLAEPLACLRECSRILKPEGFLLGTTPDPLFFERHEPTHLTERPPSFWLEQLSRAGLETQFRFSVEAYNFQFLAAPRGSRSVDQLHILQHDYFDDREEIVQASGLIAVPRWGWGPLEASGRSLEGSPATIYLLNPLTQPLTLKVHLKIQTAAAFGLLRVRLDSHALQEIPLDPERTDYAIELNGIPLPSGGHHLFFDLTPANSSLKLSNIQLLASKLSAHKLTGTLPFDLFQRYQFCGEVCAVLSPRSILDVGGVIGDANGHLATLGDFLGKLSPEPSVVTTDQRQCDHPAHLPAEGWEQPFPDQFFDLVVSLDVLEHLNAEKRQAYLEELDRLTMNWLVLGAPFDSFQVQEAEQRLRKGLLSTHRFLDEHWQLGLPKKELIEDFFRVKKGYQVLSFPNGRLDQWEKMQILTQHYFGIQDYQVSSHFNSYYNEHCYRQDLSEPAYRTIFLVSKSPLAPHQIETLNQLIPNTPKAQKQPGETETAEALGDLHQRIAKLWDQRRATLEATQFLGNERLTLIQLMEDTIRELKRQLKETPLRKLALRRLKNRLRQSTDKDS